MAGAAVEYHVVATKLNIRAGAGQAHAVTGELRQNDVVMVKDSEHGWAHVDIPGRGDGWVSMAYLVRGEAFRSGDEVIAAANLNLRSGPGTQHSVVRALHSGERIRLAGVQGEWAFIEEDGVRSYLHTKYLR